MRFKDYKGETLYDVEVSYKIDGVRAHNTTKGVMSRAGVPLHNIVLTDDVDVAEVFCGSWETTVSAVRTHCGMEIAQEHIYSLLPDTDRRLLVGLFDTLTEHAVSVLFLEAKSKGYEGLVLKTLDCYYKVKGTETYDVPITGIVKGKGKFAGMMGALETPMGKVGTGFSEDMRMREWKLGEIIEVVCMELTPSGRFRHPRFYRLREDKSA